MLDASPASIDKAPLFDRAGLTIPVRLSPIWLAVALAAIAAFLADVGVRRVRIDLPALARWLRKTFAERAIQREARTESLHAARAQAKERLAERGAPRPGSPSSAPDSAHKFEAPADALARSPSSPIEPAPDTLIDTRKPTPPPAAGPAEEQDGMSRLLRAKRRARGDMDSPSSTDAEK